MKVEVCYRTENEVAARIEGHPEWWECGGSIEAAVKALLVSMGARGESSDIDDYEIDPEPKEQF